MTKLQDCFANTNWDLFKRVATQNNFMDLNTCVYSVSAHLNFCGDKDPTDKSNCTLLNQKPWMNRDFHSLLKVHDNAFCMGNTEAYQIARSNLRQRIKEATAKCKQRSSLKALSSSIYGRTLCPSQTIEVTAIISVPTRAAVRNDYRPVALTTP